MQGDWQLIAVMRDIHKQHFLNLEVLIVTGSAPMPLIRLACRRERRVAGALPSSLG